MYIKSDYLQCKYCTCQLYILDMDAEPFEVLCTKCGRQYLLDPCDLGEDFETPFADQAVRRLFSSKDNLS